MQPVPKSTIRAILGGFAIGLFCIIAGTIMAKAEGVSRAPIIPNLEPSKAEPWTGPSIAIGGGWTVGTLAPEGESVGLFAEGGNISGVLGYDKQFGKMVAGIGVGYAHYFGELADINHDVFGYGRLGFLVTPNALLYGRGGYGRLDTKVGGIDSWRFSPGVELRIPESPMAIDLFYELGMLDVDKLATGIDVRSHTFGARIVFRPFQ